MIPSPPAIVLTFPRAVASDSRLLLAIYAVEDGPPGNRGNRIAASRARHATDAEHVAWLRATLVANGLVPTPFVLCLAWNAGATTVIERRCLSRHYDYARRCVNLYESGRGV